MNNKKIIIFSLATVALLVLTGLLFINKDKSIKNNAFFDNVQSSQSCGKEGDQLCNGSLIDPDCIKKCCAGLKEMVKLNYGGTCVRISVPGASFACSKCGNGVCDTKNEEDSCSCPEDCK